jgi:hypothetical protein
MRLCSNPSVNPAFERILQIAGDGSGPPAAQMATTVTPSHDQPADEWTSTQQMRKQVQTRLSSVDAEHLCLDYQAGATLKQLAAQYRLHSATAAALLEKAGIVRRSFNTSPADESLRLAVELYGQGSSTVAIGDIIGCSPETVRRHLIMRGIQLRNRRGWGN